MFSHPAIDSRSSKEKDIYKRLIQNPIDLTTISVRLKQDPIKDPYYKTFKDWSNDFSLIFSNAITYDRETGPTWMTGLAQYYKHKLQKFIDHMSVSSDSDFTSRLGIVYARYLDVLSRPPSGTKFKTEEPPIEEYTGPFEEYSLSLLMKKLNKVMQKSNVVHELLALLPERLVQGSGDLNIDVGTLSQEERKILWDFVRKKEREMDA
jgi:hypothetical protein